MILSFWPHAQDALGNCVSVCAWSSEVEEKKYQELTYKIIGVYYDVYNELAHGFLESVYQKSLGLALENAGLSACWPISIPVWFRGQQVGQFEGDMLVQLGVLLDLKEVEPWGG